MKFVPLRARHWPWVTENIKCSLCEDTKGIVILQDEQIVGAAVFDSWTKTACTMHIAVKEPKAWRAGFLQEIYSYVFSTAGRRKLIGNVLSTNTALLLLLKQLGWDVMYIFKDGFDDGVDIIYPVYTKEQWNGR